MKFSSRTNWNREPNALSRAYDERKRSGKILLDLTNSNPTQCGIAYPQLEIFSALADKTALRYQPNPRGLDRALDVVARYYLDAGVSVDKSRIVLTSSTSEAYAMILRLLCNAGENILVPRPSYPLFEYLAGLSDVPLKYYKLRYDGSWSVDIRSVEENLTNESRAIVLVHPHNPTGFYLKKDELASIREVARRHGLALVVDEVFGEYSFRGRSSEVSSAVNGADVLTFVVNGISKFLGLPQMKLGWIAVGGPQEETAEAVGRLEIIADTFLSVNTPVQAALPSLMRDCRQVRDQIKARTSGNYAFLVSSMKGDSVVSVLDAEGGWYGVVRVPNVRTDEEWALHLLEQKGVYVQPGYFFDFDAEGYLVVSLLMEEKIFRQGITEIVDFVRNSS